MVVIKLGPSEVPAIGRPGFKEGPFEADQQKELPVLRFG